MGFPAAEALAEERNMLPPDADEDLYAQVSHCSWPACLLGAFAALGQPANS